MSAHVSRPGPLHGRRSGDPGYREFSSVRLTRDVMVENRSLPSGAAGTVVAVYRDGAGYEVEFDTPFHAVVTLEAVDLDT